MPALELRFGARALAALPTPAGRVRYRDTETPCLFLRVYPTGRKSFFVIKRARGRPRWLKLGDFPMMTVEQARRKALEVLGELAEGKDPAAARRKDRAVITFGQLFERYMEDYARPHKRTWKEDERLYNAHLRPWRTRRVDEIRPADVARLHRRITEAGAPTEANRLLALARHVFNWGRRQELIEVENPCRVKANPERSRDRFLDGDELRRFFDALSCQNPKMQDLFMMLVLTGARLRTVREMAWVDIDLDKAIWRIPGEKTKNGTPLVLPLVPQAVDILRRRFEENRQPRTGHAGKIRPPALSPWVFPSREDRATRGAPVSCIHRAWRDIIARAGLVDVRIHDLRRTVGSWLASSGASLPLVGRVLGHKSPQATAVYARFRLDPLRAALEDVTRKMLEVARDGRTATSDG